jgi:hypothetical protein
MIAEGINKFVLIGENVLNFHCSDNSYYEEWNDDVVSEGGWIIALNFKDYVINEMIAGDIQYYIYLSDKFKDIPWRKYKPAHIVEVLDELLMKRLS